MRADQKINQKITISQSLTFLLSKMHEIDRSVYLNGFMCAYARFIPDDVNFDYIDKIIKQLYTMEEQQAISKSGVIQILVQASSNFRSQKGTISSDKLIQQFKVNIQTLIGEMMCNRKHLRMKWIKQPAVEPKQQNLFYYTDLNLKQEEQSIRLIQQLQQQDKIQIKQAKKKADKESEKLIIQFLKAEESKQNDRKKKLKQIQNMKVICEVCTEQIPYFKLGTLGCGHVFHKQCIKGYINTLLAQKKIDIPCPSACGAFLSVGDIDEYSDQNMRKKYLQYSLDVYVERNGKDTSWCPTAGCTAVFSFDGELDNYRCPACTKHYCLSCQCQFHKGMSCKEYKISRSFGENDKKFVDFVAGAKYKQCPNCKFWVERSAGCNAMKCRCGIQFCYDCGGIGCPHGSCRNTGKARK